SRKRRDLPSGQATDFLNGLLGGGANVFVEVLHGTGQSLQRPGVGQASQSFGGGEAEISIPVAEGLNQGLQRGGALVEDRIGEAVETWFGFRHIAEFGQGVGGRLPDPVFLAG